ncbi:MAG TPA: aminotransferase class V-fold PLP-dependent enzyme [Gaiellaceae bacterium]
MPDPLELRTEHEPALELALAEAKRFLATLDDGLVRGRDSDEVADAIGGALPDDGDGALEALRELSAMRGAATRSPGPRFFHFVTGGATPAALGADWLASALDQNAFVWTSSPLGTRLEAVATNWLKELFYLPAEWSGILTTGATMANFVGLAAARRWYGERHGVDVEAEGFAGLPPIPVLGGGYIHASAEKALAMLGVGTARIRRLEADDAGRLDLDALQTELERLDERPAILLATAGEVNAGDFDPIERMAELAERFGAWLHVDGAFGLFARASESAAELAAGIERAHSVIADGHKWLNVPYECGFAFVREPPYQAGAFAAGAPYLTTEDRPAWGFLGPEMSRRARSFATWATLRAYGRNGYRAMVERHLALARRVGRQVEAAPELELLAPVKLNVVCFRLHPAGLDDEVALDELNRRVGAAVIEDGRVYFGTTVYRGHVCFRPAIVNWLTTERDVDLIVETVRELAAVTAA